METQVKKTTVSKKTTLTKEEAEKQRQIKLSLVSRFMDSIEFFAQEVVPHMLINEIPDFHKELYSMVTKEKRLVLAAPRGFAKSTVVSVIYPIWLVCTMFKKNILIISASESLAVEMLRKIKMELERNELLNAIYGSMKTEKWAENHIITNTGVTIMAKGAGAQIRGFRPDCVILDDIETDESVESEEQRKKLKDWLFKACLNTLVPEGQFIMVGSVISVLSILNELLLDDNRWTKRRYKAYKNGVQEPGNELWASLWNHDRLQQRKLEIGSFRFSSEFMNDPISDETAPIKPNQIRYWEQLPTQLSLTIIVDPAYSEDSKADFKVASLIGIDNQLNRYLCSYIRNHSAQGEFMDAILNMWLTNKGTVTSIGIPNSGVEKSFFKSFIDRANSRNLYPPVAEIKHSFITATGTSIKSKKSRIIASLQPLFESGKYYIHRSHEDAKEELLTIGQSRWDDIVDTMAYAEQLLTPMSFEEEKKPYFEAYSNSRNSDYGWG